MNTARVATIASSLGLALFAGWAWGGIEGSKHDFSREEWSGGDRCAACHTPETDEPPTAAPLWEPNADLNRVFGTPLRESRQAGMGTVMCLRCHDGTIARATISTPSKERFINQENPGLFGTGHGTTDHPVGVPYPAVDSGFRPATSVIASGAVALPNGNVECISCHDPHDMAGAPHMLVRSNARSALCLTCHRK